MPSGKLNKPGSPAGPVRGNVPPARPPAAPLRPQASNPRPMIGGARPANPVIAQAQTVRRDAIRQAVTQVQQTPRPVVRPAAPPQRVMPVTPRPAVGPTRPPVLPARPVTPAGQAAVRPPIAQQAMPPRVVPSVRPVARAAAAAATLTLNTSAANPQISAEVASLQSSLSDLQRRSTFTDIQTTLTSLGNDLTKAMNLLESARSKGYAFQKDLEEIAYGAMDQWQSVKDQVAASAQQQAAAMQNRLWPLQSAVGQLNASLGNPAAATSLLSSLQSQVNGLLNEVDQIENSLEESYAPVQSAVSTLNSRLNPIHWALGQLAEAKFKLESGEDLVMAVAARWDQVGDDDPEGVLYLTNKRLVFERKEKVATKKVLFVTVASQLVQEVMIDQPASAIQSVKAQNKGLFGHQDFIEVQFRDAKLGLVPFHLNGQPSKQWAGWIEAVMNGTIENERATGSGLSYADLTGPLTPGDVMNAQNEVNALQEKAMLKSARAALQELENEVASLGRKLTGLRSRGYAIEKNLEAEITILATQWDRVKLNTEKTIEQQSTLLSEQMQNIQPLLAQLVAAMNNLASARPLYMQLKSNIASVEAQAEAAEATAMAQFDAYGDEIEGLSAHLDWVGWMLDALETATFSLLATESGVAAVEAVWQRPGLEAENGILFLTDQRLLWEDRVGEFELKLDVPLAQVNQLKPGVRDDGQPIIHVEFGSGAPYPNTDFLPSAAVGDDWVKMFTRAKSGGYANDRAIPIDEAEVERVRNAPQQCTNCGAALTAPILRGQTEIRCEYCGAVMRI